jgi:hypothetical protein
MENSNQKFLKSEYLKLLAKPEPVSNPEIEKSKIEVEITSCEGK